jgi:hypothetical protein
MERRGLIFRKLLFNIIIRVGEHTKDKIDKIALRISLALFEFKNALNIELLQELKEKKFNTQHTQIFYWYIIMSYMDCQKATLMQL